jgi:hypothetical protein
VGQFRNKSVVPRHLAYSRKFLSRQTDFICDESSHPIILFNPIEDEQRNWPVAGHQGRLFRLFEDRFLSIPSGNCIPRILLSVPISVLMDRVNRTQEEPKGEEDHWNVEQALDHAFPGWRKQRSIFAKFKAIQTAFRRAAVEWAATLPSNSQNRSVLMPHKGAGNKRTADKAVLPVAKAIEAVQIILQDALDRQALQLATAMSFAHGNINGPHMIDADEEEEEEEEEDEAEEEKKGQ